jgi:PTS system ascorbate-specific IIA component
MASVLVIAHRPLASALIAAARHVYSRCAGAVPATVRGLDVDPGDAPEELLARARALVDELDQGSGVLVLTDLLGATPGNIATRLIQPGRVRVLAGVNLAMLLRVVCYGTQGVDELAAKAAEGGRRGIEEPSPAPSKEDQ